MRRAWAAAAMLAALAFTPAFADPPAPPEPPAPPAVPLPPVPPIPPELPAPPVPVPSIPPELPAPPLPTAPSRPAGCAIKPGPADGEATCSYVATGEGRYLAATQAYWSITVYRTQDGRERVVFLDEADGDDVPVPQQLPTEAGDRVVLTESVVCPAPAPCGIYGVVGAFEPHP